MSAHLTVEFSLDNDAFHLPGPGLVAGTDDTSTHLNAAEVRRLLVQLANRIEHFGATEGLLKDYNGNPVGRFAVTGVHPGGLMAP